MLIVSIEIKRLDHGENEGVNVDDEPDLKCFDNIDGGQEPIYKFIDKAGDIEH